MIALTGATGFLGRRVAPRLVDNGHSVRCLTRTTSDAAPLRQQLGEQRLPSAEIVSVELTDAAACESVLAGCDVLIHAAARMTGSREEFLHDAVTVTESLLQSAAQAGVRRVVLISSLGVYDGRDVPDGTLTESASVASEPAACDPYTHAKLAQEQTARSFCSEHGLELIVIRPGVLIGEGRDVLTSRCGLHLGPLFVQIGGRQRVPFCFVENCADAVALAVAADVAGETVNVIDDDSPTAASVVRDVQQSGRKRRRVWLPGPLVPTACGLFSLLRKLSGNRLPPLLTPMRARSFWGRLNYDNTKAKERLGWAPAVPVQDAIQQILTPNP